MEWKPTLQGTYGPYMNAFWWVVGEIYSTQKTLHVKLWSNSMNGTEVWMNEWTNKQMDEQKDKNYIPLGINAGAIIIQTFKPLASLCSWAGQFESYLVTNCKDRFSLDVAQITPSLLVDFSILAHIHLSHSMKKSTKWLVHPAKTQSDQSFCCALNG